MGAVSIVGSTAALARRAERCLAARDLPVAAISAVGEETSLADALDAAARHPATACVLILAHTLTGHAQFAAICRAAAPHLPLLFVSAADLSADPYLAPWLHSIGVLRVPSLAEALDALPVLTKLDSPAGNRCLVVGGDESLLCASAASVERAGFEVEYRIGQTLADALGRLDHDVVLTVVEEPVDAQEKVAVALAEARAAHDELPLLIVADGSPAWRSILEQFLDADSVCVVGPTVNLGAGLACLSEWERSRRRLAQPGPRTRDASRLRRVVRAMRSEGAVAYSPATQADLIGALGLPYARSVRVAYLEDSLIAAAELGYPLRIAAVHSGMTLPEQPIWMRVPESSQLMQIAEAELGAATRSIGRRAELVIAEAQKAETVELRVRGMRHPAYGIVVLISSGDESTVVIPPATMEPSRQLAALGLPNDHTTFRAAIADGVRSAYSALAEVSSITEIALSLDVGPTGFSVRHAMISTGTSK